MLVACTAMIGPEHPVSKKTEDGEAVNQDRIRAKSSGGGDANPYSLTNIQAAYDSLAAEEDLEPITFEPSHYYVRFLPQDSLHLYILHDSLYLELFDHPMDRILTVDEKDLYANDLTEGYCWQYTIVPTDFGFPTEFEHEILDEVYIQLEDDD